MVDLKNKKINTFFFFPDYVTLKTVVMAVENVALHHIYKIYIIIVLCVFVLLTFSL